MSESKLSKDLANAYSVIAKDAFEKRISQFNEAQINPEHTELVSRYQNESPATSAGAITASGSFSLASAFIHSWLSSSTPLVFTQNDKEIGKLN